jgi:hypothetical protein
VFNKIACAALLAAAIAGRVFGADAAQTTPAPAGREADLRLRSVLRRGEMVLATTDEGLYQASVKERVWRRVETPPAMRVSGVLHEQGPELPLVVFTGWSPVAGQGAAGQPQGGMIFFLSKDGGKTWAQIAQGRGLSEMQISAKGDLYALDKFPPPKPSHPGETTNGALMLCSHDLGKTWRNITPELGKDIGIDGLYVDENRPGVICVNAGDEMHGYSFQADDTTYQWKEGDEGATDWEPGDAARYRGQAWGSDQRYGDVVTSTLGNFFTLPFLTSGNYLQIDPVLARTDRDSYTFRKDGPKIVRVQVVMHPAGRTAKFLDYEGDDELWGMHVQTGGAAPREISPFIAWLTAPLEPRMSRDPDSSYTDPSLYKPREAWLQDPRMKTVELDATHPYTRDIDLSRIMAAWQVGLYKVQLIHSDEELVEPGGTFGSQVFEVDITE